MYYRMREIPDGSFEVAGFANGRQAVGRDDIDLSMNFLNLGNGVFEASQAFGEMSAEGNIALGLAAIEAGVKHLKFRVLRGRKVTRWATYTRSDEQFDYYSVDLQKSAELLNTQGDTPCQ